MPKISVIMPVYNTEGSFLTEAIESILNQTFKDFEFIIINDCSTDENIEQIVLSYKDERIVYLKNEQNLGIAETINVGLKNASGEYIARMDSDDISLPERFEKQVDFLDKNSDVGVLGTWYQWFPKIRLMESFADNKHIKECLLTMHNEIGHPTVMLRNSVIKENNAKYDIDATYVEDYALWLDLLDKTNFANIPEVLLNYRKHSGSICKKNTIKQNLNCQKIMFEAQGKYFKIDNNEVLSLIEKLKNNNEITTVELLTVNNFVNKVKQKMFEHNFSGKYEINRIFYKYAIKCCKKDLLFFKSYLTGELTKLLRK